MELNAMKEREAICDVCHKMWQRGIESAAVCCLVSACAGQFRRSHCPWTKKMENMPLMCP